MDSRKSYFANLKVPDDKRIKIDMDYKEKYEEAYKLYHSEETTKDQRYVLESLFPELKESEDEKIRKELIGFLRNIPNSNYTCEEMALWLEKQGGHAKFINGIQVGDKVTRNEDGVLVNLSQLNRVAKKQGEQKPADEVGNYDHKEVLQTIINEQKPAWSEEDELYIRELESLVKQVWATAENKNDKDTIHKMSDLLFFLKTLKPQLKQEWSEEDEYMINFISERLFSLGATPLCSEIKWLKSLRPQTTWKPSERQKEALLWCVVHLGGADRQTLGELLEELNKL